MGAPEHTAIDLVREMGTSGATDQELIALFLRAARVTWAKHEKENDSDQFAEFLIDVAKAIKEEKIM